MAIHSEETSNFTVYSTTTCLLPVLCLYCVRLMSILYLLFFSLVPVFLRVLCLSYACLVPVLCIYFSCLVPVLWQFCACPLVGKSWHWSPATDGGLEVRGQHLQVRLRD